ncbi:MAG TPA: TolC family protein [Flavisolibacter sp.]
MKKIFCILLVFYFNGAGAQSLIDSISSLRFTMVDSVGEELVKIAMNNPALKVIDEQIEAGKYEWEIQRAGWLNNFNASFNLNEGNLKSSTTTETIGFYPRYNFNLSIPLGHFITRGKSAKKARAEYEEVIQRKEVQKANLREAVLVAYQNYQMNRYLLSLQEEVIQDEKTIYDLVQERFKLNTITLEAFAVSSKKYSDALVRRVSLVRDVNVSKYQLESLIGMPLEQALESIRTKQGQ